MVQLTEKKTMRTIRKDCFAKVERMCLRIREEYESKVTVEQKSVWTESQLEGFSDSNLIGTLKARLALTMGKLELLKEKQSNEEHD